MKRQETWKIRPTTIWSWLHWTICVECVKNLWSNVTKIHRREAFSCWGIKGKHHCNSPLYCWIQPNNPLLEVLKRGKVTTRLGMEALIMEYFEGLFHATTLTPQIERTTPLARYLLLPFTSSEILHAADWCLTKNALVRISWCSKTLKSASPLRCPCQTFHSLRKRARA